MRNFQKRVFIDIDFTYDTLGGIIPLAGIALGYRLHSHKSIIDIEYLFRYGKKEQ